ncbi:MAG: protein kinase [Deltaproteobacteria bacterium]|nr:protein kinase [Deltaproteobacteria bacterium]
MQVCPQCFGLYGPEQNRCPTDGQKTAHYAKVLIGLNLGPYVVRSMLNEGGMGVVYSGEHPTLGRKVALKVLRPELSLREGIVERFTQEARAVNTIGHRNIVNIYDFGTTPFGTFYIAMEYLEGRTLRELIDKEGPQPLARVRLIIDQLCAALSAAHSKGFVHRDVKPENVMLCARPRGEYIKLLDFGIAKLLTSTEQTNTGAPLGTPQYMAPEQIDGAPTDHRADIYALGAVTYELLTARLPHPGHSHAAVRQSQLAGPPAPPSALVKQQRLAPLLDHAVAGALEPTLERRFDRINTFHTAFLRGLDATQARDYSLPTPAPRAATATMRGRRLLVVAIVTFVSAGLAAFAAFRHADPPPTASPAKQPQSSAAPSEPSSTQLVEIVQAALHARSADLRQQALRFCSTADSQRWESSLSAALADEDPRVRRLAARLLAEPRQLSPASKRALSRAFAQQVHQVENPWLALDLATALCRHGVAAGKRHLLGRLKNAQGILRTSVLEGLAFCGDPAGSELRLHTEGALLATRMRRWGLLVGLSATKDGAPQALDKLLAAARAPAWETRIAAASALARQRRDTALPIFRAALKHAPLTARRRAAVAFARLGLAPDPSIAETLLESLATGSESEDALAALSLARTQLTARQRAQLVKLLARDGPKQLAAALILLSSSR